MKTINGQKFVAITAPELKDNGAPTITYVDTKGWTHVRVLFTVGVTDVASTAAPTLTECNTSGGSYAAITGAALAGVISATDDGKMFAIDLDLTNGTRKRFIKPTITAADGTNGMNIAIHAILSSKNSGTFAGAATESGLEELISVG